MTEKAATSKKNWFARHKILTTIGVLIVLAIIGSASSGNKGTQTASTSGSNSSQPKNQATTAKLNEVANDGKFAFTVTSVECGKTSVGTNQYLQKQAQGQFCLLNVSIKNIGDQAQSLFSGNQYLYDAQNHKYSADDQATLYAGPSGSTNTWYNDINPGNAVSGTIVFDVPKDVTPATAELHDSAFSHGVKVNLQ